MSRTQYEILAGEIAKQLDARSNSSRVRQELAELTVKSLGALLLVDQYFPKGDITIGRVTEQSRNNHALKDAAIYYVDNIKTKKQIWLPLMLHGRSPLKDIEGSRHASRYEGWASIRPNIRVSWGYDPFGETAKNHYNEAVILLTKWGMTGLKVWTDPQTVE